MTTKATEDSFNQQKMYDVLQGRGPFISNVLVTDGTFANALALQLLPTSNANIVITGLNFDSNTRILIANTSATELSLISNSQLTAKFSSIDTVQDDGTVILRIVDNRSGFNRIYLDKVYGSQAPTWQTSTVLGNIIISNFFTASLSAQSDSNVVYALAEGSSLPGNLSLESNGYISGYVPSTAATTNFTIKATDEEGQISNRTFTLTIIPEPPMDAFVTGSNVSTTTYTYNSANYIAHVFLEGGTFQVNSFSNLASLNEVDMFIVGGGGGGGGDQGGGGGGGVANNYANVASVELNTEYVVVVGGGGGNQGRGGNTTIVGGNISLFAGGGGQGANRRSNGVAWYTGGGCGGPDGSITYTGGGAFVGFPGGNTTGGYAGGGGGGMGSSGGNGGSYCGGGMGGNGLEFAQYAALWGSPAGYFGGGGRGGAFSGSSSVSTMTNTATGGGGDGKCGGASDPGTGNGDPGTGGGGGGGVANSPSGAGAGSPGGHGIVIIRYPTN